MCTITLNSKIDLKGLLSFYENSIDFIQFFTGVLNFYQANQERFLVNQVLISSEFHHIVQSVTQYVSTDETSTHPDERKFGRYFTPKSICHFINQRVLKHYRKIVYSQEIIPTILDPSAGIGFFLVDMFFFLLKIELKKNTTSTNLKYILSRIYGFELDEKTRDLGVSLFLSIIGLILLIDPCNCDFKICSSIISENVLHQDFLKADIKLSPDIVIGNPPYVRVHKMDSTYNTYLRSKFISAKYDFDIYVCFFEKCMRLLRKGGILGFITPEKYLLRKYGGNLRQLMLLNCVPLEFIDISRCKDIFEVFTYPLITILRKSVNGLETSILSSQEQLRQLEVINPDNTILFIRTSQFSHADQIQIHKLLDASTIITDTVSNAIQWKIFKNIDYNRFLLTEGNRFDFILDPIVNELQILFQDFSRLSDSSLLIFSGTPRSKYYHRVKENIFEDKTDQPNALKFIMSKNIAPFCIFWDLPVGVDHKEYHYPQYMLKESVFSSSMIVNFQHTPKLILKANSRNLTAAIDYLGYCFMGAYGLIWKSKFLNPEVLCAIINSDLINYYITRKYQSFMVNSRFLSVNSIMIKNIPLPGRIDPTTGKFYPVISEKKYKETTEKITQIVKNLEEQFRTVTSRKSIPDLIKLKEILYVSQLNTKINCRSEEEGENNLVQSYIEKLNHLIFELYNIPTSIL